MAARRRPTIYQRRLVGELRRLRLESGLGQHDVACEMEWSVSKQEKLETGAIGVRVQDLRGLLELFEVPKQHREELLELCREGRLRRWWQDYGDAIPVWLSTYLGFEDEAASIRVFEIQQIPALLQTPAYARAVRAATHPEATPRQVEHAVEAHLRRQAILTRPDPARIRAVIDEAAILRQVGGPTVMREQLDHLTALAGLPNITVRVLPNSAGAHACMGVCFTLLDFPRTAEGPMVFFQTRTDAAYLDEPPDVQAHQAVFDRLASAALPERESVLLIGRAATANTATSRTLAVTGTTRSSDPAETGARVAP